MSEKQYTDNARETVRPCTEPSNAEIADFRANLSVEDRIRTEKRRQSHTEGNAHFNMNRIEPSAPGVL